MKDVSKTQSERVCVPRSSGNTTTGHFGLPNDMMERAVTRLGWLGLIYAATLQLVHWERLYTLPAEMLATLAMPAR